MICPFILPAFNFSFSRISSSEGNGWDDWDVSFDFPFTIHIT